MPSPFDGMAGILSGALGGVVTHTPVGGATVEIPAIFREQSIAVPDDSGREILGLLPVLRVTRPLAETISRGDTIVPANGKSYRVVFSQVSGSPASDAFVLFELELT